MPYYDSNQQLHKPVVAFYNYNYCIAADDPGSGPGNEIIIGVITASVVSLLALSVLISVLLLLVCYRRKRKLMR